MSHPDEPRFNYPPCPTCGGKQVRMSATVANPTCPNCLLDQAKFKALGIPEELLGKDTPMAKAFQVLHDVSTEAVKSPSTLEGCTPHCKFIGKTGLVAHSTVCPRLRTNEEE